MIAKFGPEVQHTLLRSLLFWRMIDPDLQSQIKLKNQNVIMVGFTTRVNTLAPRENT